MKSSMRRLGEKNPQSKLTSQQVAEIKLIYLSGVSQRELAKRYNISQSCVSKLITGIRWNHTESIIEQLKTRNPSDIERFHKSYAKMPSGCWEWTLSRLTPPRLPYGQFKVRIDGHPYNRTAHRWIYQYLHGELPENLCVLHRCDNPPCVNPDHLFVGTVADNNKDRNQKGRSADRRGEKSGTAKLTSENIHEIKSLYFSGITQLELSEKYNVARSTIGKIVTGTRWRHTRNTNPDLVKNRAKSGRASSGKKMTGEKHPFAFLTADKVAAIRQLSKNGMTDNAIAKKFNLGRGHVYRIVKKQIWKHVT